MQKCIDVFFIQIKFRCWEGDRNRDNGVSRGGPDCNSNSEENIKSGGVTLTLSTVTSFERRRPPHASVFGVVVVRLLWDHSL